MTCPADILVKRPVNALAAATFLHQIRLFVDCRVKPGNDDNF
jgi:hypothetical protein